MTRYRLRYTQSFIIHLEEILRRTHEFFGVRAQSRYRRLIEQAVNDLRANPERPGSKVRPEIGSGFRTYHLYYSRGRARIDAGIVKKPRHFFLYRIVDDVIEIVDMLHDRMELNRHLPE